MPSLRLIAIPVTLLLTFVILSQVLLFLYLQIKLKSTPSQAPSESSARIAATPELSRPAPFNTPLLPNYSQWNVNRTYFSDRYFYQRGAYTVLTNYVQGTDTVPYFQTVTLVTHSTTNFLDNVLQLIQFWSGPISLAVYAPGPEFELVLAQISYFRDCPPAHIASAIKSRVSFHIFFETEFVPEASGVDLATGLFDLMLPEVNCSANLSANQSQAAVGFRAKHKLFYPINVARNVGREMSKSHFVFVSDIELFPNPPDLIPRFLELIQRRALEGKWTKDSRHVFVLPPFELSAQVRMDEIPRTKVDLQRLLRGKRPLTVPFHYYACYLCHKIPGLEDWIRQKLVNTGSLDIFHSGPYVTTSAWEPFYIGSRLDPPFDERLFRENALNKVIQAAILCHSNYTFHILDNAFLVHKPGLKYGKTFKEPWLKIKGIRLAQRKILPLQFRLYGRALGRCWQIASQKPM